MQVVIVGAGSVGRYMAEQLAAAGHAVTLVDNTPAVVDRRFPGGGSDSVAWELGDACELPTLTRADVGTADVVAAVTGDDEDNLVVSLLAKQEFGVPRVLARVNNPRNEWMFNEMWGVDVAVSTPHLLAALVEQAVSVGSFVRLMSFEHGKSGLAEVTLAENSPACGCEISSLNLPRESTVVAVIRDGHVVVPRADTTLHASDQVVVLTAGDVDSEVRAVLVG